jgi:hypothetical protein
MPVKDQRLDLLGANRMKETEGSAFKGVSR